MPFLCTSLAHLTFPRAWVVGHQTKDITSEKKTKKRNSKEKKGIEEYQNPVGCEGKAMIELRGKREGREVRSGIKDQREKNVWRKRGLEKCKVT